MKKLLFCLTNQLIGVAIVCAIGAIISARAAEVKDPKTGEVVAQTLEGRTSGVILTPNPERFAESNLVLHEPTTVATVTWANVLTVSGLTIYASPQSFDGMSAFYCVQTHRPDKPSDIVVILYTKDGKRWRSHWVADRE